MQVLILCFPGDQGPVLLLVSHDKWYHHLLSVNKTAWESLYSFEIERSTRCGCPSHLTLFPLSREEDRFFSREGWSCCSKGLQDHVWSKGVSQRYWGISYFFLKTHMDGKQRTLNHLDQGEKVKVNDGKDAGPPQRFFGLSAAEATPAKVLQQKFLKLCPKKSPWAISASSPEPKHPESFPERLSPQNSLHSLSSRSTRH